MLADTTTQIELTTERLTLRPLKTADVARISLYSSDWRVASKTTNIPHPNPPGAVKLFVERAMAGVDGDQTWAIDATRSYGTDLVGMMGLRKNGEIGYWIGSFFWGLGIASEAVGAVVSEFAAKQALRANVFQENPASRRVLEKNGFKVTGEGESFSLAQDKTVKVWKLERGDG